MQAIEEFKGHFRANPLSWLVAVLLLSLGSLVIYFLFHMDVEMRRDMLRHDQRQHVHLRGLLLEQQLGRAIAELRQLATQLQSQSLVDDRLAIQARFQASCDAQPGYRALGVLEVADRRALVTGCREGAGGAAARAELFDGYLEQPAIGHGIQIALEGPSGGDLSDQQVGIYWPQVDLEGRAETLWGLAYSLAKLNELAGIDHHSGERLLLVGSRDQWLGAFAGAPVGQADLLEAWEHMHGEGVHANDAGLFIYRPLVLRDAVDQSRIVEWMMVAFVPSSRLAQDQRVFLWDLLDVLLVFLLLLTALYFYSRGIIGKQVQMLADLRRKQAFLDSLLDSSSDAMITLDLAGVILAANARAASLFGVRPGGLEGGNIEHLLPSDYQTEDQNYAAVYQRLGEEGLEYRRRELIGVRDSGEDFPVEVTYCRLKMQDPPRLLLIIREITERKVAERELDNLRMQYFQQEKMAQIGLLVAGILHEVGNPLAAIRGLLDEVIWTDRERETPLLDDHYRRNLELVLEQTDRIRGISHEISGFASPHQQERGYLSLNGILEGTARLLSYDKRWKHIGLTLALDPQLPAIEGVSDQLTQVFMNLLVNASDAFDEGVRDPQVKIATSRLAEGVIMVSILDNGTGIAEEDIVHIFEAFYTTKPKGKGTGLGLSICEKLIEEHGGYLEIESRRGEGTDVRIYFEYQPMTFG